jgi:hypothetical protein
MTSVITAAITVTTITVTGMQVGANSQQGEMVMTNICCKKLVSLQTELWITESNPQAPSNHRCSNVCHL